MTPSETAGGSAFASFGGLARRSRGSEEGKTYIFNSPIKAHSMTSMNRFYWMAATILIAAAACGPLRHPNFITTILVSFFFAYTLHPFHLRLAGLTKAVFGPSIHIHRLPHLPSLSLHRRRH